MKNGFTLVELIIALGLFIAVMTISMGSLVNIFDVNRKSRTLKTAISSVNLAIESMSRELRFGESYDCGPAGNPKDCASGGSQISFISSSGTQISYIFDAPNGDITQANVPGLSSLLAGGSGQSIVIDNLTFYVIGAELAGDGLQPKVLIKVTGHAGTGKSRSDFTVQTLVSQRALDI